jgi:pilus assembly protein Flp/PilA
MQGLLIRFVRDDGGATAIEYGLIAAMIAVAIIAALTAFGGSVQNLFGRVRDDSASAMDTAGI